MKIKKLIYQTPEMTEEKLLKIMDSHLDWIKKDLKDRLKVLHTTPDKPFDFSQAFLDEYDLIQDKKSRLTKSQRDLVIGFVGACMIKMAKGNGGESTSSDRLESIPEIEEIRDNS